MRQDLTDITVLLDPGLEIASIGRSGPLEAEGTLCGKPFCFRANEDRWAFAIADQPGINPGHVLWHGKPGLVCRGSYEGEISATDATLIIQQCARELLSDHYSSQGSDHQWFQ
ncbi:MAG TPA: hypothetical protein VHP11_13535 [Tepidisphaeraceae bacterium]|nr:hypothetical protein [Tepidisphaeraceae bacterium]